MQVIKPTVLLLCALACAGCAGPEGAGAGSSASAAVNDKAIVANVKAALATYPEIGPNIDVESSKGFVSLRGEVKSIALRRKANAIARRVDGVMSVDNYLVVVDGD